VKKQILLILMVLLVSVTACGGNTEEEAASNTPEATAAVAQATDTVEAEAPAPAATESVADATPLEPGCYPESIDSLITMAPNDLIPVPSDKEWQTGGSNATVSVVEYSDFQ
jgi:protein-disulfide isomerase